MNILVANWTWYPSGGDWTYVDNITTLYREKGHTVIPFSMKDDRNFPSPWSRFFIENIDYKKIDKKSISAGLQVVKKSIYSTEAKQNLERLLDEIKIDLAHINVIHHYITPVILKTLKDRGIPILWTLHEYTPICPESTFISHGKICEKCFGGAFYHCATNKCKKGSLPASIVAATENYVHNFLNYYQYVDHYLCPSMFLYDKFRSFNFFPEKLVQLYHGYQYNEVEAVQMTSAEIKEERYIVFVGRLEKIKGAHTVLKALTDLPDIHLKVVGTGTQEKELQDYATTNQMTNVTFMGKQSKKQTLEIINGAEFLICPSEWYEVLGFTVVEAMALGKPVIGSDIGAIPEMVINGETGILFAPGNAPELSEKIRALFNDQEAILSMGKKAKKHIHQIINTEKHFSGLQKLIPSL
ncbi:glycosyltransferase family 4 protein [Pedobacter hartonius]|uniref:Glycosyltransferase involved in cell wall bisynthesis n=1 Tax=Pedobacter hartonius TaxID=425514 RepID=A0A1H4FPM1_9SPHI|nr:glycosyltransferase family 4 protein [Pedobacter hartonius]SEA99234.1 Glycosyltransferase involved in cell wall bisynthesis [Pedobacter hartonius]